MSMIVLPPGTLTLSYRISMCQRWPRMAKRRGRHGGPGITVASAAGQGYHGAHVRPERRILPAGEKGRVPVQGGVQADADRREGGGGAFRGPGGRRGGRSGRLEPDPPWHGGRQGENRRRRPPPDGAAGGGELPVLATGPDRPRLARRTPRIPRREGRRGRLGRRPQHDRILLHRPGALRGPRPGRLRPGAGNASRRRDVPRQDLRRRGSRCGLPGTEAVLRGRPPPPSRGDPQGVVRALLPGERIQRGRMNRSRRGLYLARSSYRKHSTTWSFTMPTACMNA